ncbi:arsenosugar biosynthesis radical SAM (seleno)protein ArsS [Methylocucumis oryzae]|uniref:Fe-S oxidoreductase n=1 Tax=Methylocucumis oryzae TaxID=1632867 RepID=A0A0F3IFD1_9GAMM|nr:arsenosugar biosynthesis radical SAM (seleno)protein ArsS [Methylocucumis oryzae]KJV05530.1 Fe-S oxidoreductase [Methylocucumis oryzae]
MRDSKARLLNSDFPALKRGPTHTVQLNLGYLCNLSCQHCHVNAGPKRTELMTRDTMQTALQFAAQRGVTTLDLTGGAPELNPNFRWLVTAARQQGLHVIDRCNLTVLLMVGQSGTAEFLAAHQVEITASLPCYLESNVDAQRGKGVFQDSLTALHQLNALGYGQANTGLVLNLAYNPQGPVLPPPQATLEHAYKDYLHQQFGIHFNRLFTLTNMPIQRFGAVLQASGEFDRYLALLKHAHQPANLEHVMCRSLLSVDWQGFVYDCDFNQLLGLPLAGQSIHIEELLQPTRLPDDISVAEHCYGCTAGQGSSCQGGLG